MTNLSFEFRGSGFSYLWLLIWTTLLSFITLGLFFPWAYSAQQRWIASNTYVNGQPLTFQGTGLGFLGNWLLIMLLTLLTFGLYTPWAYCQLKRWETDNTCLDTTVSLTNTHSTSTNQLAIEDIVAT